MFARALLRSTQSSLVRPAPRLLARRTFMAESPSSQISSFMRAAPVPVEAYPLVGIVSIMCTFAAYHLSKHIIEDHDHLRWHKGMGLVEYVTPELPTV